MHETIERVAQRIFEQRGYTVVATTEVFAIGSQMARIRFHRGDDRRTYTGTVIQSTDRADFVTQCRMAGFPCKNLRGLNFYRIVSE